MPMCNLCASWKWQIEKWQSKSTCAITNVRSIQFRCCRLNIVAPLQLCCIDYCPDSRRWSHELQHVYCGHIDAKQVFSAERNHALVRECEIFNSMKRSIPFTFVDSIRRIINVQRNQFECTEYHLKLVTSETKDKSDTIRFDFLRCLL